MDQLDLETRAPDGWFSQYDIAILYPEVEKIPENGIYLEVGVYHGRSLWVAREAAKPSVEVWGIDELPDPEIPNTHYIRSDSHKAAWDKPVDVLFIDADHSYAGCKGDIDRYAPFVKKGGVLLFHDYDITGPGVIEAVDEYAKANNLKVETYWTDQFKTSIAKIQL